MNDDPIASNYTIFRLNTEDFSFLYHRTSTVVRPDSEKAGLYGIILAMSRVDRTPGLSGIVRRVNPDLLGGVASGDFGDQRKQEILDSLLGFGRSLAVSRRDDWYGPQPGDVVSFEEAEAIEEALKAAIDGAVVDENVYPSEPGRVPGDQDAPCRTQRRRWWG